jgi:hypothetical protein
MFKTNFHIASAVIVIGLIGVSKPLASQVRVRGTVYDNSMVFPLPSVSVLTNSGKGTTTDTNGNYQVDITGKDSIWFSYLGKPTRKYAVSEINDPDHFDISILINIPVLKEVTVKPYNYREDSIQNRLDYAKAFNYKKPDFNSIVPVIGLTVIVDIDELIRAFQYRKKYYALSFQKRLLQQEKDKFIDNRFNKGLVLKLTKLNGAERDRFMILYRPGFEFTSSASDYDFNLYIKNSFKKFRLMK